MSALSVFVLALILYGVGIILPALSEKREEVGVLSGGVLGALGAVLGVISSLMALCTSNTASVAVPTPFVLPDCALNFCGLSALMVLVISVVSLACSVYAISYVKEYLGKGAYRIAALLNGLILAMMLLVVVNNALYFIVLLEAISLTSYFLVREEGSEKTVKAANQYLMLSSVGSICGILAFAIFYVHADSLSFSAFHHANLTGFQSSVIFLLALVGFGFKAGMLVFHRWLPTAEPVAPSHASAMMSGVMVKMGIFGFIKVAIVLLGATHAWWGYVVLIMGCLSAVFGVLYALAEHNIKRLLAYHTVENIGIILMGVGVSMIGIANHHPILAVLGLLGALYHLMNHAIFKGLLFLGAGSIIYRLHTKDMEKMGGLARWMPYTALAFFIGTVAISALPPLNGFVSEWFIYQSLFHMSKLGHGMVIAGPLAVVMLAITGAFACMCFVKVYGVCFSGAPRSEAAATKAREVPMTMRLGMLWLALLCLVLGIGSPWVAPMFAQVAAHVAQVSTITVTQGALVVPATNQQAVLSTPVITIALILLLIVPFALKAFFRGVRLSRETNRTPWACGYDYEERMSVSAGGFTQTMRQMFAPLYRLRVWLDPAPTLMETLNKIPSVGSRRLEGMSAYYAYALIVILVVLLMSIIGVK